MMLHKARKLNRWLFLCITILGLLIPLNMAFAKEAAKDKKPDVKVFVGYNWYKMDQFNAKLRSEGNEEIKGGLNVGVEFSPVTIKKISIPVVGGSLDLKLPIVGIEYLEASSTTTHASTTVKWDLPVVGAYLSIADIQVAKSDEVSELYLYWRPINVGYYTLGKILPAGLTVSDRPGKYEASDSTVGFSTELNLKYYLFGKSSDKTKVFLAIGGGYRWLKFRDVELNPKGGFTTSAGGPLAQNTVMPESLDYSGVMVKTDFGIEF